MNLSEHIAKHFREVYFGGNWTCVSLRETLADVSWQQATRKVGSLNTIATLVFHMSYYVEAVLKVLQGRPLSASDKLSFGHPPIQSGHDWQAFLDKVWTDAGQFAALAEQLPESRLWETFSEEKYRNYYRNLQGIIEHTHYHLGQIALIRKMMKDEEDAHPHVPRA